MIRVQIEIDPKLRPLVALFAEAYWWFTTFRISPMAPHAARAVIQRAELRRPTRTARRLL